MLGKDCFVFVLLSAVAFSKSEISLQTCNAELNGLQIEIFTTEFTSTTFRLSLKMPNCTRQTKEVKLFLVLNEGPRSANFLNNTVYTNNYKLDSYNFEEIQETESSMRISEDGMIAISNGRGAPDLYSLEKYCITNIKNQTVELYTCDPEIKKCCPLDETYDFGLQGCASSLTEWAPNLYSSDPQDDIPIGDSRTDPPNFIYNALNCSHRLISWYNGDFPVNNFSNAQSNRKFRLLYDGTILFFSPSRKIWKNVTREDICMDKVQNLGYHNYSTTSDKDGDLILMFCAEDEDSPTEDKEMWTLYYVAAMINSSVFLFVTMVIYILLMCTDKSRSNIHGWTTFSFLSSMFLMFSSTVVITLYGRAYVLSVMIEKPQLQKMFCIALGVTCHFAWIATFSWLTTLNFDLLHTIRNNTHDQSKKWMRFRLYSAISWGIPICVVTVSILLDRIYDNTTGNLILLPRYGSEFCFIEKKALGPYLYYIISVLFALNIPLIAATFSHICQHNAITASLRTNRRNPRRSRYLLMIKLFIVMGASWSFEIASWMATPLYSEVAWYWFVIDMFNWNKGFFIFVIFAFKRDIGNQLVTNYSSFKRLSNMFVAPSTPQKDASFSGNEKFTVSKSNY